MSKSFIYTLQILIKVEDSELERLDLCYSNEDDICVGDCGGECESYFIERVKTWLNNYTNNHKTELYSSNLIEVDDDNS